jgi:hypothetical protein
MRIGKESKGKQSSGVVTESNRDCSVLRLASF